jgi:hypothetical protein
MKRSKPESKINEAAPLRASRRNFARSVAATAFAAATAPLASSVLSAQTPSTTKETVAPPKPQATPAPSSAATAPTQPPSPLAEAYAEVARVRFGGQVTPEQMAQIKKDLAGNVRAADRLRAVKLQNADEPDFVFKA